MSVLENQINHIFLIDDDEIELFLNRKILQKINPSWEITSIAGSPTAFDHLKECEQKDAFPDLIFLDINMPQMNGFEFLDKCILQGWQFLCGRTIILSSSLSLSDLKSAKALSVKGYLQKPLTLETVHSICMNLEINNLGVDHTLDQ